MTRRPNFDDRFRGDDLSPRMMENLRRLDWDPYNPDPRYHLDFAMTARVEHITLEKLRMGAMVTVDKFLQERMDEGRFGTTEDQAYNQIRYEMRAFFWSRRILEKRVEHPATWLDAVKIRFLPKRLLQRFPPRMTVYKFDLKAVYPSMTVRGHEAHPFMEYVQTASQDDPVFFEMPTTQQLNPGADMPGPRFTDPRYAWCTVSEE